MEFLGIKFAPLNVPMRRRLQTLSAALWIVLLASGSLIFYLLSAYILFCTQTLRYFLLLYFIWMYYDWNTYEQGGRRNYKWTVWLRSCAWLRYFSDYFPMKLVKTADLDPTKCYLFCSFPHGVLSTGSFGAFASQVLGFKELFPGLDSRMITLDQNFRIPFLREFVYGMGGCGASEKSLDYLLSVKPDPPYTGRATTLMVGGASESLECKPGINRILVKRRKGFVRVAMKHGAPLVPVYCFGETDVYDQLYAPAGSFARKVQDFIRRRIGLAPILFFGRGFFQYSFGIIAHRRPIHIVVGKPIELPKIPEPTKEDIDKYHTIFVDQLAELFETHKHKYIENGEKAVLEMVA